MAQKTETASNGTLPPETKKEAVKRVMAKHGKDLMPLEIVRLVKEEFGMDLTTMHASNIKSTLAKEAGGKKGKGKKKGRSQGKQKTNTAPQLQVAAKTGNGRVKSGISIHDIATVKELVQRLNSGELHSMIDLFAN